jgi:hypothetical protein
MRKSTAPEPRPEMIWARYWSAVDASVTGLGALPPLSAY